MGGFIHFIKDYIYPHTNLGNGHYKGRRNGSIYKAQKFIDYRAGSCNYFKPYLRSGRFGVHPPPPVRAAAYVPNSGETGRSVADE